jgi:hypothetical protein
LRYIILSGSTVLVLAVVISVLRAGGNLSGLLFKLSELIYGNTFSDLRDSAWFFSGWNGEYILGKNYLADFMVFIPSSMSSFRQEWSYGFYTVKVAFGQTIEEHAGLRIGFFGEIFANFGWFGVIVLGLIIGLPLGGLMIG